MIETIPSTYHLTELVIYKLQTQFDEVSNEPTNEGEKQTRDERGKNSLMLISRIQCEAETDREDIKFTF